MNVFSITILAILILILVIVAVDAIVLSYQLIFKVPFGIFVLNMKTKMYKKRLAKYKKELQELKKKEEAISLEVLSQDPYYISKKEILNKHIDMLGKKIEAIPKKPKEKNPLTKEDVVLTDNIKSYINEMIELQITNIFIKLKAINERYDVSKIDEDIANISKAVLVGLNPRVFECDFVITNKYLIEYVTMRVSSILMETSVEYNSKLV